MSYNCWNKSALVIVFLLHFCGWLWYCTICRLRADSLHSWLNSCSKYLAFHRHQYISWYSNHQIQLTRHSCYFYRFIFQALVWIVHPFGLAKKVGQPGLDGGHIFYDPAANVGPSTLTYVYSTIYLMFHLFLFTCTGDPETTGGSGRETAGPRGKRSDNREDH